MLDSLSGASWFSTLDFCIGYWQVWMKPSESTITTSGLEEGDSKWEMQDPGNLAT